MKRLFPLFLLCLLAKLSYAQDAPQPSGEEETKEAHLASAFQRIYTRQLSDIFAAFVSPDNGGHATGVKINSVKITKWANGQPDNTSDDVAEYTVNFTLNWVSDVHPDGTTVIEASYASQPNKTVYLGCKVIHSNGPNSEDESGKLAKKGLMAPLMH